MSNKIH